MIFPYKLLKVVHIVSVLIWMSGMFRLFYLFRQEEPGGEELDSTLDFDADWTSPAMLVAWLAGVGMAVQAHWWSHPWFLSKFCLALLLSGLHGVMVGRLKSGRASRRYPVWVLLLMIVAVVSLVVVKPFG